MVDEACDVEAREKRYSYFLDNVNCELSENTKDIKEKMEGAWNRNFDKWKKQNTEYSTYNFITQHFSDTELKIMHVKVKNYLETALMAYDFMCNKHQPEFKELDFSPAIISLMKAVEMLLHAIFGKRYFNSIKHKSEKPITKNDADLKIFFEKGGEKLKNKISFLPIGDAYYCILKKATTTPSSIGNTHPVQTKKEIYPTILEFCEKYIKQDTENTIREIAKKIKDIIDYRNTAAHKDKLEEDKASYCIETLIKSSLSLIKDLHKYFADIVSKLY